MQTTARCQPVHPVTASPSVAAPSSAPFTVTPPPRSIPASISQNTSRQKKNNKRRIKAATDTELALITKGMMATQSRRGGLWLWQRWTGLKTALIEVCSVALVAWMMFIATFSSSSVTADELMPRAQQLVLAQQGKDDDPHPVQVANEHEKASRLPVLQEPSRAGKTVEVCNTAECKLAAAELTQAINASVDPCDNFYKFACGSWINANPVPGDFSRWTQFNVQGLKVTNALVTILLKSITKEDSHSVAKAKTFYQGCKDEARLEEMGLTPLTDFLAQFGGWPMTINDWDVTSFDWRTAVAEGNRQAWTDYLMNVWVFADRKDTFSTAIYMDQTSLGLPRSVLVEPENYKDRIIAYKNYIITSAKLIAESLGQSVNVTEMEQEMEDMLAYEKKLAEITSPDEARRYIDRMYNPMTVEELSNYSNLDWLPILSSMFASTNITLDNETRIIVQDPEYISNMTQLVSSSSQRTLSNYIMWRHVKSLGDDTTQAMRNTSFQYSMVAAGVKAEKPRSILCAEKTNKYLGMAIGTEYVKTYFSQQAKDEVNEMVEDLRLAFKVLLEVNEWMNKETMLKAIEKANAITKFIGYPDWYGNDSALEVFYRGLGDLDNRTHFTNLLTIEEWKARNNLGEFGQPSKRDQWVDPPSTVNAYYMQDFNSITFPAGILKPPFYRPNTIMALNYGGIGQVIGHEMTHGFDDQGRQYDKDGNAIPWWANKTLEAFQSRAQCMVDQYGSKRLPELDDHLPNATLNGINTQGENIADNGGLRQALLAYKMYVERHGIEPRLPGLTEYSPMQLLFLNNANIWCSSITPERLLNEVLGDEHSPKEFRVLVPMANMREFSDIWGCPAGSGMNPDHKCVVW